LLPWSWQAKVVVGSHGLVGEPREKRRRRKGKKKKKGEK